MYREQIIEKARRKYIPGITRNISKALKLYLKNDAKEIEQIPLRITKRRKPRNLPYKSKQCPECSAYMIPFPVNVSPSTQVDKQYNSVWMCPNKKCMETIYTPDTIHDIIKAATKDVTNDIASSTSNAGGG